MAPADAAKAKPLKGTSSGTVALACNVIGSDFDFAATIKLAGVRKTKTDKKVTLKAKISDMPGVAPVPINNDMTSKLSLKVGSSKATLSGKGHATAAASSPVPVQPAAGTVSNKKNTLAVTVTKLSMTIPDYAMTISCVPAESGALSTLRLK